ncbi:hypothetical protein LguiB_035266 [Lonicera macranthoides]
MSKLSKCQTKETSIKWGRICGAKALAFRYRVVIQDACGAYSTFFITTGGIMSGKCFHTEGTVGESKLQPRSVSVVIRDSKSSTTTASETPKQTGEVPKQTCEAPKQTNSETDNSVIEEKTREPSPVTKSSRRYRIISMFSEEMSKRMGRHRRSTSCPVQPPPVPQTTHTVTTPAPVAVNGRPDIINQNKKSSSVNQDNESSSEEPVTNNKNCELCAAMLTASYLAKPNVDASEKGLIKSNVEETRTDLSEQRAKDADKDASLKDSKEFLDALDIFNTRTELFLKVIQDPNSPLAHHLHSRPAFNSEKRLTKSESFPAPHSAGRSTLGPSNLEHKHGVGPSGDEMVKYEEYSTSNQISGVHNPSTGSSSALNNRYENGAAMKRFKSLRQKIRHVIRESRKERQRIVMDGFLHKVPYGHRFSKDAKEAIDLHDPAGGKCTTDRQHRFKRTASLNESVDKYCRLFESSFNREEKHQNSERCKSRVEGTPSPSQSTPKKTLERIQSLPDLRSYSFQGTHSPGDLVMPVRIVVDRNLSIGRSKFDDQESIGLSGSTENQNQLDASAETVKRVKILDDLENMKRGESVSEYRNETQSTLPPSSKLEKVSLDSVVDSDSKEGKTGHVDLSEPVDGTDSKVNKQHESAMDSPAVAVPATVIQNTDIPVEQILHSRVERAASVEFNYVKDVLQLAGVGGNDFLGTWQTTGQPVDPSVFAEVGGCLLAEPDSVVNEEGHKCNHLLLFDLINEVLLEIHERSFTYCPMPLTCRSSVHPMPMGYHVLEEVWADIKWYLSLRPDLDRSLDDAVSKDLMKGDGWMNLQFEAECVGLEIEDMVFDELLEELIWE